MNRLRRRVGVLLVLLCMQGCQTTRVIEAPRAALLAEQLEVGDTVLITTRDGSLIELEVSAIREDALLGIPAHSTLVYTVPYERMLRIESSEFSAGKTAGLVGGGSAVIYVAVLLIVASAIEAFGDGLSCIFNSGQDEDC